MSRWSGRRPGSGAGRPGGTCCTRRPGDRRGRRSSWRCSGGRASRPAPCRRRSARCRTAACRRRWSRRCASRATTRRTCSGPRRRGRSRRPSSGARWRCSRCLPSARRRVAGRDLRVDRFLADAGGIAVAEVDVRATVQVELVVDAGVGDRSGLAGAVEAPRRGRGVEVADAGVVHPAGVEVVLDDPRRGADPLHSRESGDRGNLRGRRLDVDDDAFVPENLDAVHLLQGTTDCAARRVVREDVDAVALPARELQQAGLAGSCDRDAPRRLVVAGPANGAVGRDLVALCRRRAHHVGAVGNRSGDLPAGLADGADDICVALIAHLDEPVLRRVGRQCRAVTKTDARACRQRAGGRIERSGEEPDQVVALGLEVRQRRC